MRLFLIMLAGGVMACSGADAPNNGNNDSAEVSTDTSDIQTKPLAGTSWWMGEDSGVALTFSTDGKISGKSGCNNFNASFEQKGETVTFGPVASTKKMCPDPDIMSYETHFLSQLSKTDNFMMAMGRLSLSDAELQPLLVFERKP